MSNECRQFLKVILPWSSSFILSSHFQDILIYNPKNRRTARQLLEHDYLAEGAIFVHSTTKTGLIERPLRSVLDRAIRQQTESMRNVR